MKGKAVFTKANALAIIELIKQKVVADRDSQKKIRNKIRSLGFYASDFGIGGGYTVEDFLRVIKIDDNYVLPPDTEVKEQTPNSEISNGKRSNSDEAYIIELCDKVLNNKAIRQHRFDFLKGDSGVQLPVDAYYPELNLVIEYCERQHSEEVKFFNRRQTVSGVNRGEQRKIYDQRRKEVLPENGIELIEFTYNEFDHNRSKRLKRNSARDIKVIMSKLSNYII